MAGQHRDISDDGTYRVTIGSVDTPRYPDDWFFVSQQDDQGNHMTTIRLFDGRWTLQQVLVEVDAVGSLRTTDGS